jgi:hypothetical protein
MIQKEFVRLRERLSDPLLTALTVMLAVLMFVIAPLQAVGVVGAHYFGFAFGLMLVVAVFVVSGSVVALTATLFAFSLVVVATILRLRQPSAIDIYLDASAWLIAGLTLAIVVARAVFAPGEGQLSSHRWCDSALPGYWTNFRGAVLPRSAARPQCVYRPSAPLG